MAAIADEFVPEPVLFEDGLALSAEQLSGYLASGSTTSGYSVQGKKLVSPLPDYGSDFEFDTDEEKEIPPKDVLCKELLENQPPLSGAAEPLRLPTIEEVSEYNRQVFSTRGFEVDAYPFINPEISILPASTSEESLDKIVLSAKAAVKHENKRRQKYNLKKKDKNLNKLKLVGIVRAMSQGELPFLKYYLTLKVEEMIDQNKGQEKSYQSKIFLFDPPERPSFAIFREKGETARYAGSDYESDSETQSKEKESDRDSIFDFDSDFDIPDKVLSKEHVDSYKSYYGEDEDYDDNVKGEGEDDDDDDDDVKGETEVKDVECDGLDDDKEEKPHSQGIICCEMTDGEMEEYDEQVRRTGGFDVKFYPNCGPGLIQPAHTYGLPLEWLVRYTKAAVKSENKRREKDNDRKLKLVGIVKAMHSACCVIDEYYITLKAKEMGGEEESNWRIKIYEVHVCANIPLRKAEFVFFREQGQGNDDRHGECAH